MRRWLRVTLPPDVYIAGFLALFVVIDLVPRMLGGDPHGGAGLIGLALTAYGVFRVAGFHPVFSPDYRNWLASTPWTSRLPLPVGPVHLVVQDVLIVGSLAGFAVLRYPGASLASLVLWFVLAYVLCMTIGFSTLQMRSFAYLLAFGMGLLVLVWPFPRVALIVVGVLYAISLVGLHVALRQFDRWDVEWMSERQVQHMSLQKMVDRMREKILGWPFDHIRPKDAAPSITYLDGVLTSLLVGWWVFVVMKRIDAAFGINDRIATQILVGMFCQFGLLARIVTYCWGYAPPISFWGRIFTLRWVIPGYDQVFVAPLLGLAVTVAAVSLHVRAVLNVPVTVEVPVAITLLLLILINVGPSLKRWRLTGNHRVSSAALTKNSQSELLQI